jgi:multidrug efflux system outer membrane protein
MPFSLALILSACTLYPKYERPCIEMPAEWRFEADEASTCANIRWWEAFGDPVLNALIQEALASNYDLKVATARIAEFRAQLGIVSSRLYPQVGLQGSASRQRISQTTQGFGSFGSGTSSGGEEGVLAGLFPGSDVSFSPYSNDYLVLLTASYEVDLWGKIRSASEAAYADLVASVNARRSAVLSVVSAVASAYMQLRQYDLQLFVSQQTVESRRYSLKLAQVRFEEGLTSELEVRQAASELDDALLQVVQYETLIPQQENLISILVGHPPQAIQRDRAVYDWQLPPQVPAGLPADLLEQRPDILEAEDTLIAANFRIGEARALYFPDLTLTGNYGYESAKLHELFTDLSRTWQWMVNLLQPLFTGWRITSTVKLTEAEKEAAAYQYLQTILTALQEVDDALIAHQNSKEAFLIEQDNVHQLKDYLRLATLQYDNGLVDYLNVLDAERRLFASQLNLAQVQADVFLTLVNLYKALGGGWVIDAEEQFKAYECPAC